MTIPQVVDGVTDADATFMNQLVDAANQANAAFNGAGQITTAAITPALEEAYDDPSSVLGSLRASADRADTQSLDVRKLGAKGDSTTDDTAAIQAALDEGYPRIIVPPPVSASDYYKVTEPLYPLDNQEICGASGFQSGTTG